MRKRRQRISHSRLLREFMRQSRKTKHSSYRKLFPQLTHTGHKTVYRLWMLQKGQDPWKMARETHGWQAFITTRASDADLIYCTYRKPTPVVKHREPFIEFLKTLVVPEEYLNPPSSSYGSFTGHTNKEKS